MKSNHLIMILLLWAATAVAGEGGKSKAPDFTLPRHDGGGEVTLSDALAKGPVVVDFWATWCGPCKRALPRYEVLYQKYREQGLSVLAVSQDDPRSQPKIRSFFTSQKLTFPALLDTEKKVGRRFGVQSLPVTFLVHPDGTIVSVHQGYRDGDERVLEKEILGVLADLEVTESTP